MATREERVEQLRLLREGYGREREEPIKQLSRAEDDEAVSMLAEALKKSVEDAKGSLWAVNFIGRFGTYGRSTGMEVYGDLSDESRWEAEAIATVLANIGSSRAFDALAEAWKDGLRTIEPHIRKFGKKGDHFLRPRSLLDRMLRRREWADKK